MNIHAKMGEAERVQAQGDAIFERLLPRFQQQGLKAGTFVAIDIASGDFVSAGSSLDLMALYEKRFGKSVGWVRELEYGGS